MDAIVGHQFLSFLDAYLGYNQIPMHPPDSVNTSFITPTGMYCYNVMPFDLKNVEATYQRTMYRIFEPFLGRTMEVYIDDKLVKSKSLEDHLSHLQDAFRFMRLHYLRLNPEKCTFGVGLGNFLGFLVSQWGIEMAPRASQSHRVDATPCHHEADTSSHRKVSNTQQIHL